MKKKIFISYSRADGNRVYPLVELLRATGTKVFLDIDSIEYGEQWEKITETSVRTAERVLVFWSKSAEKSKFVKLEYHIALGAGVKIIPVPLDSTPLPPALAQFQSLTELLPLLDRLEQTPSAWQRLRTISWKILLPIIILAALIFLDSKATQYLFIIVLVVLIIVVMMRNVSSLDSLTAPDEIADEIDKMLFDDLDSDVDDGDSDD